MGPGASVSVTVPTNRPDVRAAPDGVADLTEEVARAYGYARLPRRRPAWPDPGRLTQYQRERRTLRQVLVGAGALEVWTPTFLAPLDHVRIGLSGPDVEVANPLVADESSLRRSELPGLLRALAYNVDHRQGGQRLFEVGTVFAHPEGADVPTEREMLSAVLATAGDDATSAVAVWHLVAEALRLAPVSLTAVLAPGSPVDGAAAPGLHPTRSAWLVGATGTVLGSVGEVDPAVATDFGVGRTGRVGWLEVDLGLLLDPASAPRVPEDALPVSRFPSGDVDVALVVDDAVPADRVAEVLVRAGGDRVESVTLFDVFRGAPIGSGRRSLAFRLRFGALDHTLSDAELAELRARCITAAEVEVGATLR